ncbi:pilin [Cytobacillus firmus]|uniref:pilin n=1 Tax=Cytobacillus firmus TaxID=1399 RepID=UPI0021C92F9B|nr:pilin [Cytobacillus firmus]MCU1808145.1 pilin [Cytobacillus firmus]
MKKSLKKLLPFVALTAVFAFSLLLFSPEEAAAAWKKSGISPQGDLKNSKIYTDLANIVYFITAVGGFWVIGCLLFAGMRLSAAQGGNPQARTQGFIGILMAGLGIFIIVKATTIAGWFAGFGGS